MCETAGGTAEVDGKGCRGSVAPPSGVAVGSADSPGWSDVAASPGTVVWTDSPSRPTTADFVAVPA